MASLISLLYSVLKSVTETMKITTEYTLVPTYLKIAKLKKCRQKLDFKIKQNLRQLDSKKLLTIMISGSLPINIQYNQKFKHYDL